jgi:hypothetical protein
MSWADPRNGPVIRWTSYEKDLDAYQGELVNKETYVRQFLDATKRGTRYDFSRLDRLWQHLIAVLAGRGV